NSSSCKLFSCGRDFPGRQHCNGAMMKIRVSIFTTIVLFGVITALGLCAILAVSMYANSQLRVGGPLYSQIKLGNDLVADILPPPAYVVEGYLEATLALRDPKKVSEHK